MSEDAPRTYWTQADCSDVACQHMPCRFCWERLYAHHCLCEYDSEGRRVR